MMALLHQNRMLEQRLTRYKCLVIHGCSTISLDTITKTDLMPILSRISANYIEMKTFPYRDMMLMSQ